MLEALVVGWSEEDWDVHFSSGESVVQRGGF